MESNLQKFLRIMISNLVGVGVFLLILSQGYSLVSKSVMDYIEVPIIALALFLIMIDYKIITNKI